MPIRSKRYSVLLLITVIILGFGGTILYYVYNPKKAVSFVFPDLNKISYVNAVIQNDSAYIDISLVLENKNPYRLSIDTIVFELKLADTNVAKQTMPLNIRQSRFDKDTVKLPLNLKIPQMMRLIQSLQQQDSTTLEIKGYIVYETFLGRAQIDVNKKLAIEVPVPPKIKVLKVEREGFSFKDRILKVNASVQIINESKNLDVELNEVRYEMTVKETLHAKGIYSKPIMVKPQSKLVVNVPMELEIYHPLNTAMKIMANRDEMDYLLHLTFTAKENLSEKSLTSPAEITARGQLELKK